jgi:UDP-3-O-[3-hydroxymyristoyl] glucosamine N-acyltransferase
MQKTLGEIAELVDGAVVGDANTTITGVSGIKEAEPGDITFLANPKYLPLLSATRASAVIVGYDAPECDHNLIRTEHPYLAFTKVLKLFAVQLPTPKGIHPTSIIGLNVLLGKDVALHAGVVLEDGCKIRARSILYPGVCVGSGAEIGADCTIYPRVVVSKNVSIGNKVIIHMGAVIGAQSQPAELLDNGNDESTEKTVIVEDDVEIGANVTIDGSVVDPTRIGSGTKIDNLVYIGAGAVVGSNCIIVSHASVGSGCRVGKGVIVAGQASILDGITIGDGAIIAARAGVIEDVGANQVVSGFPASSHEKWLRIYASMKRLPTMARDIRELEKRLRTMEELRNAKTEDD